MTEQNCKTLLMADGKVGLRIASNLIENFPQDIAALITTTENEISEYARKAGIQTTRYVSEGALLEWLGPMDIDIGLLAWWPHLVSNQLLERARRGFVNTHPSLLPFNRGKHYNFWAIVEEVPFGVSLHSVTPGVDDGPIIAQTPIAYDWVDTGGTLYEKAQKEMINLVQETWPKLRIGQVSSVKQNLEAGSFHFASELEGASALDLDNTMKVRTLLNLLRARSFPGYPACSFQEGNQEYEIRVQITRK